MHPDFDSVEIGGRNLRYLCRGEGAFTVVLEQGQGDSIEEWYSHRLVRGWPGIINAIREHTRTFVYDRAGLGWSDGASGPRTSRDLADDLRAILRTLSIPPPYILVGHSIGGFTVRHYATHYPADVAGVVLVDSAHPEQQVRLSHLLPPQPAAPRTERLELHCLRANPGRPLPGGIDFETSAGQIRATPSLANKPLIVVSRGGKPTVAAGLTADAATTIDRVWSQLQGDLLGLSTNSRQIVAEKAGHDLQHDAPEVVIDAVTQMLHQLLSASSLCMFERR